MKRYANALLIAAIACFISTDMLGQGIRATVVGRVTDQSGAIVPGVKITITNAATNESRNAVTSDTGDYALPQLPPGDYNLTTELTGFSKVSQRFVLETGQGARVDIVLKAGAITEEVAVTAISPLVSTENASIGNVVDQKKIVELPLNGRDYLQLAQLQPNVFAPAQNSTVGFRGGFNVSGNSEVANNYIKDGIDNNDETTNQPLHRPILDAVLEFKVLTGTYGAEYGRQAGGQIIVTTKSGSNDFHGSAFEFHRNSVLDARNFFAPTKPSFRRNQFGGVIGGPIRRDRTFFFGGYEGQRRGQQEAGLATVPTLAMKQGDFGALLPGTVIRNPFNNDQPFTDNKIPQSMWNAQGAGLLGLYPNPNATGSQNNFVSAGTGKFRINQFSGRIDHRITDTDNVFGVYEFADSSEFYPISNPLCSARDVPGWGCDEKQRTQHVALAWIHIFGPRLVNEARIGYSRFGFYRLHQDRDVDVVNRLGIKGLTDSGRTPFNNGSPELIVTGFSTIGGPTNLPQGRHDNTYHYVENMTFNTGKHALKWGLDIRRFLFNSFFTSFGRGSFRFDGRYTGQAVADMLLGLAFQGDRNLGEPFHNAKTFSSGYYIQDDWKINSKLTFNLGLRYEYNLPPIESVNKMSSFDPTTNTIKVAGDQEAYIDPATGLLQLRPRPGIGRRLWRTDKNDFAPRIGLAWRPFGGTSTVVRAGFGTYYNYQIVGNGITPLSRNSPFRQRQTAGPFAATARPNVADIFAGTPSVVAPGIDPNFRTAYINQWSLGIQKEVATNLVVDISYLGSEGHKLPIGPNINQAFPGPGTVNSRRPFQGFGNITGGYIESIGNSNYNGLTARVERRFNQGLSFVSSYTWSKSIDQNVGISTSSDSSVDAALQDSRNLRAERGLSDFDVNHRLVFSYVYDLPFGPGRQFSPSNRVVNYIARGWQMTGIWTWQTGRPFTIRTGTDQSNTGQNADRPNLIGDWNVKDPGPQRWFNACTLLANGALRNCLPGDTPAWQQNAPNTFGNAGRNIVRGPGLANFDLGVSRFFEINDRHRFQFRTEVFNLANHPNFFLPVQNLANTAFGTIQRAANTGTGAQRQIQFGLKYMF